MLGLEVLIQISLNDQIITVYLVKVTLMQAFLYCSIHWRKIFAVLIIHITASNFNVTSNTTCGGIDHNTIQMSSFP
jgi:hypothetical protein